MYLPIKTIDLFRSASRSASLRIVSLLFESEKGQPHKLVACHWDRATAAKKEKEIEITQIMTEKEKKKKHHQRTFFDTEK